MGNNAIRATYVVNSEFRIAYSRVRHTAPVFVSPPDMGEIDICQNTVAIESLDAPVHERLMLQQNSPNPFNPSTSIRFRLDRDGPAALRIYDESGRLVRTLLGGEVLAAGQHEFSWDGRDAAGELQSSGVYLYELRAGGATVARKMVMVR
jgi:hypothetical protein